MRHMLKPFRLIPVIMLVCGIAGSASIQAHRSATHVNGVLDLWAAGTPAFGVFVPDESSPPRGKGRDEPGAPHPTPVYTRAGGERLAANPLYDFVFLNLEGAYDATAIKAIAEGLRSPAAATRKTLLVR